MENRASVLLILPEDVLTRARVLAGRATVKLKLPVSLQITLRALIEEGLKQQNDPALLASIEARVNTVRRTRRLARLGVRSDTASRSRGNGASGRRR